MLVTVEAAGCPNSCRHCGAEGGPPFGALYGLDELRRLAGEWGPLCVYHEPTAHPGFPQVLAPSISVQASVLSTNGYGLARRPDWRDALSQLRDWGYEGVSCTLHGLEQRHDWFARRPGAFRDITTVSRQALEAGMWLHWNVYLDALNLPEIAPLVELCRSEYGCSPVLSIPHHRVNARLWHYEELRPSLDAVAARVPEALLAASFDPPLTELTEAAWATAWARAGDLRDFRHPMEPESWPPEEGDAVSLVATASREMELETCCGPRMPLGPLADGKAAILARLRVLPGPHPGEDATLEDLRHEDGQLLHTSGFSVRYKAMSLRSRRAR